MNVEVFFKFQARQFTINAGIRQSGLGFVVFSGIGFGDADVDLQGRIMPLSAGLQFTSEAFAQLAGHEQAIVGKGAGYPVWPLVPKLLEVDIIMSSRKELQERVYEFHPELAWRRLAGRRLHSKKSAVGLLQRFSVLDRAHPGWLGDVHELDLSKGVQLDDVLDAVVGLSVAQAIVDGTTPIRRIPESDPPVDERGLRMEIWY